MVYLEVKYSRCKLSSRVDRTQSSPPPPPLSLSHTHTHTHTHTLTHTHTCTHMHTHIHTHTHFDAHTDAANIHNCLNSPALPLQMSARKSIVLYPSLSRIKPRNCKMGEKMAWMIELHTLDFWCLLTEGEGPFCSELAKILAFRFEFRLGFF